jgi:hypothetical protein
MFRIVILVLALSFAEARERPRLNVYHFKIQEWLTGDYQEKRAEIRRAKRLFKRLTKTKILVRTYEKGGMVLDSYFGCLFWSSAPKDCLWGSYQELKVKSHYKINNTSHYFLYPPIKYQGSYWIGGAAITGCYKDHKWKREMNYLSGVAYGNYLKTQVDGTTRIPHSIAIMMHEWGHLVYGLTHDGEEENYLMNSLFNVKGFSSQSAPELWRLSEKSKKEIRRCRGS